MLEHETTSNLEFWRWIGRTSARHDVVMKVRDVVRQIKQDGWVLHRTRGSHRQFRHPFKSGTVTVAGGSGEDVPAGTLNSILKQARLK